MPDPRIASTRTFCPADIPEASIPKSEMIRSTRPADGKFQDAVISQERPGHVNTRAGSRQTGRGRENAASFREARANGVYR